MGHLGVVLYEYLGEEYPEVLGSILGALKAIVNVIGMSKVRVCTSSRPQRSRPPALDDAADQGLAAAPDAHSAQSTRESAGGATRVARAIVMCH
jgi:hypothetical protein